ncbi:hypothetical protein AAMO2058_001693900 [Amorphochlora amoebiformis]
MEEKDPDIVIVGAGPVGLFLAIQIVLRNPTLKVVMMEKYAEYKRKHVLRIEKESLETGINDPRLVKLVSELKGKTPTSLIEENFKALAGEIGISIRVGEYVKDIEALQKRFHNTRYFIGADGRKSVMRTQKFGDNLCLNYNVMKVAFCKYRVEGETSPFHWTRYISLVHDSNHTIYELIGKPKDGVTSVTLQIFVSSEELEKMSRFNFKDPAKIADLESVCPKLAESLNIWLKARKLEMKEKRIDEPKINPVPLDLYQSTDVVKRENGVTYAIVGDAAFGLPFFRALNDGLLCATKLSKAIVEDLSRRPQEKIRINNGQVSASLSLYYIYIYILLYIFPKYPYSTYYKGQEKEEEIYIEHLFREHKPGV